MMFFQNNDVFPKQEAFFTPKSQFLAKWSDSLNDIFREKLIRYTDGKLKVWYLSHTLKTWKRLGIWDLEEGGVGTGIVK